MRSPIFLLCMFFALPLLSQEGVRNDGARKPLTGKIMLVPFEPKMYMSEIDQKVNQETGWKAPVIREYFRKQLDAQVKLRLQSVLSPVVSFYTDSVRTCKDLDYIYKSTQIHFDLVGKATEPMVPAAPKQKAIKDGQLSVEISEEKKFSSIKFIDLAAIGYLHKKYLCEYFVFINELNIQPLMDTYDLASDSYQREASVHYTVVNAQGKLVFAGIATARFSSRENNPKRIAAAAFQPIGTYLATRLAAILNPPKSN